MFSLKWAVVAAALFFAGLADTVNTGDERTSASDKYPCEKLSFGFAYSGRLLFLATPQHGRFSNELRQLDGVVQKIGFSGMDSLRVFPCDAVDRLYADKCGDTITVLWSGGYFKAVIEMVGQVVDACGNAREWCSLTLPDSIANVLSPKPWETAFLVLRKGFSYSGPLIPYTEYHPEDTTIQRIRENLHQEMLLLPHMRDTRSKVYGVLQQPLPDTLLVFVLGSVGASTYGWRADYRLAKSEEGWSCHVLTEPHKTSWGFEVRCAFDLNGDGILEYLGGWKVFTIERDTLRVLCVGDFGSC